MKRILEIDVERCKGCGLCVEYCPKHILKMSEETNQNSYPYPQITDQEKCIGCGNCYTVCPDNCFKLSVT
jgi:2-oxoglutarate ferredoxin oxidoreductase subunit delta